MEWEGKEGSSPYILPGFSQGGERFALGVNLMDSSQYMRCCPCHGPSSAIGKGMESLKLNIILHTLPTALPWNSSSGASPFLNGRSIKYVYILLLFPYAQHHY